MGENGARCWQVHRYDVGRSFHGLDELLPGVAPDLAARARDLGVRDGQRFMIGPDGRPDLRVNACLGSAKWRNLGERKYRDYTYSVGVWLNYLVPLQVNWWDAVEGDAEEFLFWRANVARVQTNSFTRDLAGLKKFYRWMSRYGVANPFDAFDAPRALRSEDVKWLDAGGYKRWLDLGIRGMDLSGRPDRWWRGRNEQRDVAFCDGRRPLRHRSAGVGVGERGAAGAAALRPSPRLLHLGAGRRLRQGRVRTSVLDATRGDEVPAVLRRVRSRGRSEAGPGRWPLRAGDRAAVGPDDAGDGVGDLPRLEARLQTIATAANLLALENAALSGRDTEDAKVRVIPRRRLHMP
ncbi:hypothetical protein [Streptomyces sp. NPDC059970]|uniref:hypothetical protein n=1 Tax=Streptomyces sp. NPDC059970 TaxID=3347019 RepID=UPI00369399A1